MSLHIEQASQSLHSLISSFQKKLSQVSNQLDNGVLVQPKDLQTALETQQQIESIDFHLDLITQSIAFFNDLGISTLNETETAQLLQNRSQGLIRPSEIIDCAIQRAQKRITENASELFNSSLEPNK